jgi:hypothetical protein
MDILWACVWIIARLGPGPLSVLSVRAGELTKTTARDKQLTDLQLGVLTLSCSFYTVAVRVGPSIT